MLAFKVNFGFWPVPSAPRGVPPPLSLTPPPVDDVDVTPPSTKRGRYVFCEETPYRRLSMAANGAKRALTVCAWLWLRPLPGPPMSEQLRRVQSTTSYPISPKTNPLNVGDILLTKSPSGLRQFFLVLRLEEGRAGRFFFFFFFFCNQNILKKKKK